MNILKSILFIISIVVGMTLIVGCATLGLQEASVSLQPKKTLRHLVAVSSLAFSPDGKFLASGNVDSRVILWEISNEKILSEFKFKGFFPSVVWNVIFSPDGRYLAAANNEREIKVWEISTGKLINTFPSRKGLLIPPGGIRYTPDGKFLIIGNAWEKTISLWEVSTGKLIYTVTHGGGRLPMEISISVSPDGKYFASGYGNFIKLWEVSSGNLVSTLTSSEKVLSLTFSPDGKYLVSGHEKGIINIWELDGNGKLITTASIKGDGPLRVIDVIITLDGKYIVPFIEGLLFYKYIALVDFLTGKVINTFRVGKVNAIALSPDGKFLATGYPGGNVNLWDVDELIKVGLQGKIAQ
jgi:WD40 repeat protein